MLHRDSTNQLADTYRRQSATSSGGQYTNYAYVSDSQHSPSHSESQRSTSSVQKASDLRSAWAKLYGIPTSAVPVSDWRPPSRHDVTASNVATAFRVSSAGHEEFMLQDRGGPTTAAPPPPPPPVSFHPGPQQPRHSRASSLPHGGDPPTPHPFLHHPRESPMGQSSSTTTQGPTSDSSYRSSHSGQTALATFNPEGEDGKRGTGRGQEAARGEGEEGEEKEEEEDREVRTLGPASKYPDSSDTRPSSARLTPQTGKPFGLREMFSARSRNDLRNSPRGSPRDSQPAPATRPASRDFTAASRDFTTAKSKASGARVGVETRTFSSGRINPAYSGDHEENGQHPSGQHASDQVDASDSIFEYNRRPFFSESSSNRSVTPPLPPLSPSSSQPGSTPATPTGGQNRNAARPQSSQGFPASAPASRQRSSSVLAVPRTPDLLVTSATSTGLEKKREGGQEGTRGSTARHHERGEGGGGSKHLPVPSDRKSHSRTSGRMDREPRGSGSRQFARSRSLDDVRESGNESNDLSFDVETTLLTVAPSDISDIGEGGGHHGPSTSSVPPKDARAIRGQLERLESMYHDVIRMVGVEKSPARSGRRWSIASSDTSSLRRGRHIRTSASSRPSKDLRSIQRRFQRLESHVVTLARSLAHLSSELKAHSALRRDLDVMKREVREIKQQGAGGTAEGPGNLFPPFEKFRGWIPSLTNPKRINKLTQFFGQEPPLLEIFLKKLGYERYAKNFAAEHIGMIELPYMTEDRLDSIGIPMGPRLRILQESQLCFRQENFNIYIV